MNCYLLIAFYIVPRGKNSRNNACWCLLSCPTLINISQSPTLWTNSYKHSQSVNESRKYQNTAGNTKVRNLESILKGSAPAH